MLKVCPRIREGDLPVPSSKRSYGYKKKSAFRDLYPSVHNAILRRWMKERERGTALNSLGLREMALQVVKDKNEDILDWFFCSRPWCKRQASSSLGWSF